MTALVFDLVQRLSTTVVAIVGSDTAPCVQSFSDARNVAVVPSTGEDNPGLAAMAVWDRCVRSRALYTVHDADPLAPVADAWAASFTGGPRGDLELAVTEAVARWRSRAIGLPDFYLVVSPEDLPAEVRDWYLGFLHKAAPHRVVPVEAEEALVRDALGSLRSGRWWPDLDELLTGVELELPDQVSLTTSRLDEPAATTTSGLVL